jgi:hypothetical protein
MDNNYDCKEDVLEHINKVRCHLELIGAHLDRRGEVHDASKLEEPEKSIFDEYTPKLKKCEFCSDEYKENLKGMGKGLAHHYQNNSHHPEHYDDGINGMCLIDLFEMLADWKAATERQKGGDIIKSIEYNKKRFNIDDQLDQILINTVERIGWARSPEQEE